MNANKILGFALVITSAGATAFAEVPVLSVCEVLDNRVAYNGTTVIVVGRVVRTMEGEWLDQDCDHKVLIDGYEWHFIISLSYLGSIAKPPPAKPAMHCSSIAPVLGP